MERQKYKLTIAGEDYFVISEEDSSYMEELAHDLNSKMESVLKGGKLSTTQAAILIALEYADEAKKSKTSSDSLRSQLKEYLEDSARAKSERDFYKREIDRLNAANGADNTAKSNLW